MDMLTMTGEQLSRYLDVASAELKLATENAANVDTPGYHTQGFDFDTEMKRQLRSLSLGGGSSPIHAGEVDGLVERPDGNNVSMDREAMKLADAQLKFRVGTELLKRRMANVMAAIHVEDK